MNFTAIRGHFVLGTGRVKALCWLEKKKKKKNQKRKMTKHDFHHFQVRHFNNVFEQSWCHCRVGATPARRSNCLQTRRIHHQVKYWRLNANTCIVAAILFSGHPYIGRHCRATLIIIVYLLQKSKTHTGKQWVNTEANKKQTELEIVVSGESTSDK